MADYRDEMARIGVQETTFNLDNKDIDELLVLDIENQITFGRQVRCARSTKATDMEISLYGYPGG